MLAVTLLGLFACAASLCSGPPGLQAYLTRREPCEWSSELQRQVCTVEQRLWITTNGNRPLGMLVCGAVASEAPGVPSVLWCE